MAPSGTRYGPAAEAILCLTAGVPPLPREPHSSTGLAQFIPATMHANYDHSGFLPAGLTTTANTGYSVEWVLLSPAMARPSLRRRIAARLRRGKVHYH